MTLGAGDGAADTSSASSPSGTRPGGSDVPAAAPPGAVPSPAPADEPGPPAQGVGVPEPAAGRGAAESAAWILERVADAHVTLDRDFRIVTVNAAAERALGKSRAEMLGRTDWEVFPGSVDDDAGRAYRRVVSEGVEQHLTQHYFGEGYDRHLEIDAYPTEHGGVAVFWRDVTARVQAEAEVARFRLLVELSNDAQYLLDEHGRVRWVNRLACERLGYTPEEFAALTVSDINPLMPAEKFGAYFARVRGGRAAPFESVHWCKDGSTFPVEITPTVAELPEGPRLLATVRDITERKAAEAALRESEARRGEKARRLAAITENATLALFVMDEQQRCTYMNPAAERLTGFTLGELQGKPLHYHVHHTRPDGRPYPLEECPIDQALPQNMREQGTEVFVHKDGTFYDVAFTASPIRDGETGRAMGTVIEVRDIREERARERERERLLASERAARAEAEAAHAQVQEQALELELANQALQDNAAELEMQAEELQATAAHLEERTAQAEAAAAALAESEARYRLAAEVAEIGTWTWDLATDTAAFDARVRAAFGIAHDEPEPRLEVLATRVHPEDRERVAAAMAAAADPAGDGRYAAEYRVLQPDGTEKWAAVAGLMRFDGEGPARRPISLLGTALDITARKRAEVERERLTRALAVERERLAYVFQQAPSFLAVLRGPDHVFTLVNEAYYQLVGHRAVLGRPALEALPEVRDQGFKELLDRVLATGEPFIGRELPLVVQRTPGGPPEERFVDLAYMPLIEAEDGPGAGAGGGTRASRVTGVIAHGSDVTTQVVARREVEELLAAADRARREAEAARVEADEANAAKSGFLATMSHELRTPVNAVIGYAQLLDMGLAGPLTEQQRGYLERLARSGHHLLGLVNDVLDLSKIEAGEIRVKQADGRTGGPVGAALDVVAPAAAAQGVRLVDARPDEAGVPFVGDEDRVRQIALNLLSNAVKFTAPGGTVTVTCDTVREPGPAATHLAGEGPWALVRIEDSGIGIAPEEQGRIFQPFHQIEGGHTRTVGGTGLGLAISRRLARLMGGDLTVESAPGVGSAFTLWLPASRHEPGQPSESAADRRARAERDLTRLETPGLGEVGELLHESATEIVAAYTDRLRADPAVPRGSAMTRVQLEDHAISFLADLAQSLVIVGAAGPEAVELLKDGSAIQRTIAEAHGARRRAQGWDEAALRRDHQIFREEIERAVRAGLRAGSGAAEDAVHILLGLVDRGQGLAVRAWRRAVGERPA